MNQRPNWPDEIDGYDWEEAFKYARPSVCEGARCTSAAFAREDVVRVIALENGENDGPDWIGVFRLRDGRYAFLAAGCDYTGWGCQESGHSWVADDLDTLVQFGLSNEARERLNLATPERVAEAR